MVRRKIQSFPTMVTALSGAISATDTTLTVASAPPDTMTPVCLLEIDSELIRVIATNSGTGVTSLLRGDQGSVAASHANGAVVQIWPKFSWTDQEINDQINLALDWLYPEVWFLKYYQNTALINTQEFGAPAGVVYPNGDVIKKIEMQDDNNPKQFREIYNWRHIGDRWILDQPLQVARVVRLTVQSRYARFTDDVNQLNDSSPVDAIVQYAAKLCLENLLGNRTRYTEYSASLSDRASTPDELQRQIYFFYNQAVLAKDRASRPPLSGFASTRRAG